MDTGFIIDGRFEIERRVSAGGMSAVYRALDHDTSEIVAVKVLYGRDAGEHRERLFREAQILEKLSHPGIVRHIAHGTTPDDQPYLAIEWVKGETLSTRLAKTGLTMGESVRICVRVAETLKVVHAQGVLHRDIKPGNLILRDGNVDDVTLIDFGIARIGATASAITHTGVMLGTLGYMAPEQARGNKILDARADVFSLGAVLFKCLTGVPVFAADDEIGILAKMLFDAPARARSLRRDVPTTLDDLLARMLARDPRERPGDAGIVAAELAAIGPLDSAGEAMQRDPSAYVDVITRGEQRLVSVIAVAATAQDDEEHTLADGTWQGVKSLSGRLRAAVAPFGAHLESLSSGMIVATLPGRHSATDQAARSARCAMAMRSVALAAPMVLVTGRAVLDERVPIGDAVDRAIRLLKMRVEESLESVGAGQKQPIYVDEVTAGLLDTRFLVRQDSGALELVGEQAHAADAGRMLLGKPTPCVGRERELVSLEGVFAEVVADDVARAVLVTAPAGIGKSRLRFELLRTLEHRGDPHEVWTARGDPMRAGSPFGLLAQILRTAAEVQDGEPARVQREKIRARVERCVQEADAGRVTQFLAELLGVSVPEDDDVQLRAARHDAVLMGDQMRRAFEDWLAAETAQKPVLIVLEDLHWGDLPSVKFVDSSLRALAERPLMVLALARPEVTEIFPELWAERGVQHVHLKELSKKASEKLVRQVLGDLTPEAAVTQIVSTAGGNAFYLEELIRTVAEGRGVTLPETVLAMVQARLEALEPEARRVLRAASIFGQTFWSGGVGALLVGDENVAQVTAWLDELCERELLSRREVTKFRGEQEYVFRHGLVAEAAYGMFTDKDRIVGHRLAAQWLEKMGEREAVVLAEHLERGNEPKRAITFYRRAAAQALEGNDLVACLQRTERGIACGAEGEVLGRLLLRKAEAHRWRGENAEAKECAAQAMRLLPRTGRRWFLAAGETVEACARLGDDVELHRAVDELCDVSSAGRLTAPHLVALTRASVVLMQNGNYPSADDLLRTIDAAFEQSRKEEDPLSAAHVYRARAYRALVAGDTAAALSMYNVAISSFEQAGDVRAACRHLVSAGAACLELGAYAEAERALADALASAERMGLSGVAANAWLNMGMLQARTGSLEESLQRADAALSAFKAQSDRRMEAVAHLYRALFLVMRGDFPRAEHEVDASLRVAQEGAPIAVFALGVRARLRLLRGEVDAAEDPARESHRRLEALGGVEEGEAYVRLTYAETLDALGERSRAKRAIATARVRLLERAAMIRDPSWKEFFLEKIPENARTVELAREWGAI
jgi:eukaryotic-like serine/threonine-protein kinase